MSTRSQALILGLGKAKQADINTASASFLRFTKLNPEPTSTGFTTETDKEETGKGDEFASANGVFPVAYQPKNSLQRYGSAEILTWALAYALGNVAESTGVYTLKPLSPSVSIEPLYFSVAEQLPEGGGQAIDNLFIGCAIEDLTWEVDSVPGRASSKVTVNWVGGGKLTTPSGVSIPALTADHYMLAQSASLSVLTEDYVSTFSAVSWRFTWKNNLLPRYCPGAGLQNNAGLAAGLEMVKRDVSFSYVARLRAASQEYARMIAQNSGTVTFTTQFDATHSVSVEIEAGQITQVDNTVTNGIATVTTMIEPKSDPTNGVLTATAKCGISGIAQ